MQVTNQPKKFVYHLISYTNLTLNFASRFHVVLVVMQHCRLKHDHHRIQITSSPFLTIGVLKVKCITVSLFGHTYTIRSKVHSHDRTIVERRKLKEQLQFLDNELRRIILSYFEQLLSTRVVSSTDNTILSNDPTIFR